MRTALLEWLEEKLFLLAYSVICLTAARLDQLNEMACSHVLHG